MHKEGSVCDILREDILSLSIAPGSSLEEKVLAEKYQVSRTPIREALIRLAAEGLVEFQPRRGGRVIPIILPNLPRYLETSSLIHRSIARLAAGRRLSRDLRKMDVALAAFRADIAHIDIYDYDTVMQAAVSESAVFRAVAVAAHNIYLFEIFEKLGLQGQRMLRLAFAYRPQGQMDVPTFAAMRAEGLTDYAERIRQGDADGAEAQSKKLHTEMVDRLMAYLKENLTDGVSVDVGGAVPGETDGMP